MRALSLDKTISGIAPSIGPATDRSATASNSHIGDAAEAESVGGKQSVDGSIKGRSSKFLPETGTSSSALVGLGAPGAQEVENPVPFHLTEPKQLRVPKLGTQVNQACFNDDLDGFSAGRCLLFRSSLRAVR